MIRKFMKYYRPYMHILIWVIVGTFAMAGLDLIFPVVVRDLIHDVLPAGSTGMIPAAPKRQCTAV